MLPGEKIRILRKEMNLTLDDVAKRLKLKSTGHLSQIERGLKDPSESLVELFKKTFFVSENWWESQQGGMFYIDSNVFYGVHISLRLQEVINKLGLNKAELARKTGYFEADVERILEEKAAVPVDFAQAFCRGFNVSGGWLKTGIGEIFLPVKIETSHVILVPVWDTVPAGWPAEPIDIFGKEPIDYIPVTGSGKNMGALLVEGHSMSPEIRDGEYVLYTQDCDLKPGDWIVATDEFNRPMVKEYALKLGEPWLVSINPEYPSFKVNSNYQIIGKVVDIYSRRKANKRRS